MGSKIYEFKGIEWNIKSLKRQLYSVNNHEADIYDGKYSYSSDMEGNHEKRQNTNKGSPALTLKGGLMKNKRINHNSS